MKFQLRSSDGIREFEAFSFKNLIASIRIALDVKYYDKIIVKRIDNNETITQDYFECNHPS